MRYELLDEGETIQEGDQFYNGCNEWVSVGSKAGTTIESHHRPHRRATPSASVAARTLYEIVRDECVAKLKSLEAEWVEKNCVKGNGTHANPIGF